MGNYEEIHTSLKISMTRPKVQSCSMAAQETFSELQSDSVALQNKQKVYGQKCLQLTLLPFISSK